MANVPELVLGITGEIYAGKTTLSDLVVVETKAQDPSKKVERLTISSILNGILVEEKTPINRPNQDALALRLSRQYGEGILAHLTRERIIKGSSDIYIVDGIRQPEMLAMVESFPRWGTINVHSSYETRLHRAQAEHPEMPDDEFWYECHLPMETQIRDLETRMIFQVPNEGTNEDLRGHAIGIAMFYLFTDNYKRVFPQMS